MENRTVNPLTKHFRQPAIYLKLPSKGQYWSEDSLEMPVTGELPIYPMTTADEITLRTPDALVNGQGVVSVIESCCPCIKNAWNIPSVDLDALLIAIRIASYGETMDIKATCPKCNESHDYEVNLPNVLDQVKLPNYNKTVNIQGLKIKLKPQAYLMINQTNMLAFEEQKLIQAIANSSLSDEEKASKATEGVKTIMNLNNKILVDNTEYIETEDGVRVTDKQHLLEFFQNADSKVTRAIQKKIEELSEEGALPVNKVHCSDCDESFEAPLIFDYSSFFAVGS